MKTKTKTNRTEQVEPGYRSFTLETREINEKERTVELSFSSETKEVERYYGVEILDHGPESVRLDRLKDGAPLLVDHNSRDQVGVIESVVIGTDRIGRAVVRFGKSDRAEEIFNDVIDGIRTKVSVGYRTHKVVLEESTEDTDTYRVMDWEPFEISIISIAADNSVGVGRSLEPNQCQFMGNTIMTPEEIAAQEARKLAENTPAAAPAPAAAPVAAVAPVVSENERNAVVVEVRNGELKRINDVTAICREHGAETIQTQALQEGWDLNKVREAILDAKKTARPAATRNQASNVNVDVDLDGQNEVYSIRKAIIAASKGNWKGAEYEQEVSQELARQMGQEPNGFYVPPSAFRAMTAGAPAAGGTLVGTDHRPDMFIDALRNSSIVMEAGATILDGLVGNVDIPALDSDASFGWVAEEGDSTLSDGVTSSRTLTPKTVTGSTRMSRTLLKQSSPAVEAMMLNSLVMGSARAIDKAALEGGGANEPTGIAATAGVNVQVIADVGDVPTWAEMVGFESKVSEDNALSGSPIFVAGASKVGEFKTVKKDAGSGIFLMENGQVNGYDVKTRNGLSAATRIIYGNMADLLIGMWGVLDILPDPYTDSQKGGLILRVFQDVDVAVRHAESFCIDG